MKAARIPLAALISALIPILEATAAEAPPGAASCSGCHAASPAVGTPVPLLVGRRAGEIVAQVQAFRAGQRPATVMDKIAKGFSDAEIQAIASWYAEQR